jgi:hypothetical protein
MAPHSLMQEYLNRTEHIWGIVTNGKILRLLRDSTNVRKQAYVEFDLQAIIEEKRFQDFIALYRLLHRSRLPRGMEDAGDCLLEQYFKFSLEQGGRVREHLREGVEACIKQLADGFLRQPHNNELRQEIKSSLTPEALYHQLLRLVYRLLFLLVSEERGLISNAPLYRENYGITRLRRLLEQHAAYSEHHDLWLGLRLLWHVFRNEKLAEVLGVAPLNGELFEELRLDSCVISNRDLLQALWHLCWYRESSSAPPRRVNYAALDVEELGSVYESLLEFHPQVYGSNPPRFELAATGSERRTTGSHYTPTELVLPLIHHALEPVLVEKLATAQTPAQREAVILSIRVLDPACGSGHFLLAAARRLGKELARVRSGEEEPAPEHIREATRDVITHCIYGVDKNPLAVELCKVALWLEGHTAGKPLTFLDHRIRCGDSLVGINDVSVFREGIPDAAYKPVSGDDRKYAAQVKKQNAAERRDAIFASTFQMEQEKFARALADLEHLPENNMTQVTAKAAAYQRWKNSADYQRMLLAGHIWTAAFFQPYPNDQIAPITTHLLREAALSGSIRDGRLGGFVHHIALQQRFFHWPLEFPEVFTPEKNSAAAAETRQGFDVILGNPPFIGGLKISGNFGDHYRRWLQVIFAPFSGTADLCAAFFRQGYQLMKSGGRLGMIATNTLGQGDTRESGLAVILQQGGAIPFARRFVKWPGQANVEVNLVALHKPGSPSTSGTGEKDAILDDQPVDFISSRLDDMPEAEPKRLKQNEGKAFIGDYVRGIGFVLEPEEAEELIARDPRNAECLLPYLNGQDLNSHPEQQPSRYVICFHDWPLEKAQEYPDLLRIVEERVKPEREKLKKKDDIRDREHWWLFARYRSEMRPAIIDLQRVLIRGRVSEIHTISFIPNEHIFGDALVVFAFDDDYHFALLQSNIHEAWVWRNASSLESRNRYTPTDCFETFPFPAAEYALPDFPALLAQPVFARAGEIGAEYHEHRRQVMLARQLGLTKTYNLFHDPACNDSDIARLRELHVEMDNTILACYGWEDLNLDHGFYENERGKTRFTIADPARREVLKRLVALNLAVAEGENK